MNVGLSDFVRMCESLPRGERFRCGHPKTPENSQLTNKNYSRCRQCFLEQKRMYMASKREGNDHT